jgi:hypothetical protein
LTESTATRKIISIFLSAILVIGTITAFYPSISMTKVHALSEYDGMMMNYDNYKSKYSSFKKDNIECNNFNLNLNGLNVDAIPESLSSVIQAQAETEDTDIDTGIFDNGAEKLGYKDKDFSFVCINNNDNEFIPPSPIPPIPPLPVNNLCTVWQDSTPGNNEIFFSVSHDDGETFSTPQNISKNLGNSFSPQITCEGNNVYVVWTDTTGLDPGNFDIFFSFSHDGGLTFSTPDNLSENTGLSAAPQISAEGNNVYVVWQDNTPTGSTFDILFARSTDGGLTFSSLPDNLSENTGNSALPQISSEGNNVYVVWVDRTPGNAQIFFSFSHNGGQTFSTPPDFNISQSTENSGGPQISSEGNNVYVVWHESSTLDPFDVVFFARSINSGLTFSTPEPLSDDDGNESSDPQISSEGNNVYVVWQDVSPGNFEIFFIRSTDGGATFSTPPDNLSENTGDSLFPQISSEGNNVYVVWDDNTPTNPEIFFSFSHDDGLTFSSPPDNLSENTGSSAGSQISAEGDNVYVIWNDNTPTNPEIFFSFSHDGGLTFSSPPDNLSENTGSSEQPKISSSTS